MANSTEVSRTKRKASGCNPPCKSIGFLDHLIGILSADLPSECNLGDKELSGHPSKRQKTDDSATSQSENPANPFFAEKVTKSPNADRVGKKRRVALIVSYLGRNYHGSEIGDGSVPTVSRALCDAIVSIGAISKFNANPKKMGFTGASRTDKGVHAAAATFTLKMVNLFETEQDEQRFNGDGNGVDGVSVEERCGYFRWNKMRDLLNESLPSDIRVHGIQRTMKKFDPRFGAGSRVYHYLIPSYLFDPDFKAKDVEHLEWKYCDNVLRIQRHKKSGDDIKSNDIKSDDDTTGNAVRAVWNTKDKRFGYRLRKKLIKRLRAILKVFLGTKNFHNFSRKVLPNASNAKRYMISMEVTNPSIIRNGIEYLQIELHGASFMYHQIRKMIGFTVALMRNTEWKLLGKDEVISDQIISNQQQLQEMALSADYRMSIPLAPSEGLYLNEVRYDNVYNKKAPPERQIESAIWKEDIDSFIANRIWPNVMENELNEQEPMSGYRFAYWLYELDHRFVFEAARWTKEMKDIPECGSRTETKEEYLKKVTAIHSEGMLSLNKTD